MAFFELKTVLSYDNQSGSQKNFRIIMAFRHLKIKDSSSSFRKNLRTFFKIILAVAFGAFIIAIPKLLDREIQVPLQQIPVGAKTYSVSPSSCSYEPSAGTRIEFKFKLSGNAEQLTPQYSLLEIPEKGMTIAAFEKTSDLVGEFNYDDIIGNPLVGLLNYYIKDGRLIVEITRRGNYLPAKVATQGTTVAIILPPGNQNFPAIINQKPANNSAAFPALHPVSFDAVLNGSLKNAYVFFNNKPTQFTTITNATSTDETAATSTYSFTFEKELKLDTDYTVKAIVTDNSGRTSVASWTFTGQIPSAVILGKDRFKYLGWWGQIAASGVTVRKGPGVSFEKAGALSSAERVKVLEEVFGEWVDGKNLWYKIDGGKYAGNYVFSDYVTPMAQPVPPVEFKIPEGVNTGDNWIDVDLTKKILTLFDYDKPLFATYIASGRAENPTRTGTYRVWYKLKKAEMQGGPPLHSYRYDLKNIPWTMFYNYDYAIHGTYWHDRFGSQQSAGCTNMTQGDAKYIFDNTLPVIPEGKEGVFARGNDGKGTGTVVYNHE